jgi:hypothetical protein
MIENAGTLERRAAPVRDSDSSTMASSSKERCSRSNRRA